MPKIIQKLNLVFFFLKPNVIFDAKALNWIKTNIYMQQSPFVYNSASN